eukprot:scaffold1642_cov252-Pinguiococcus_pyrenoidosus.AAC.10
MRKGQDRTRKDQKGQDRTRKDQKGQERARRENPRKPTEKLGSSSAMAVKTSAATSIDVHNATPGASSSCAFVSGLSTSRKRVIRMLRTKAQTSSQDSHLRRVRAEQSFIPSSFLPFSFFFFSPPKQWSALPAKPGDAQAVAAQVIQHCGMEAAVLSRPVPRNLELRCNALGNSDPFGAGLGPRSFDLTRENLRTR